jgi:hypothetical protein
MSENNKNQVKPVEIIDIKAESIKSEPTKQSKKVNNSPETSQSATKLVAVKTNNPVKEQEQVDWFALARKLRQDNRQIIKNLVEREEELALVKEQLETQIIKAQSADNLVKQQSEELNLAHEQITRMLQELETAQKIINEKQTLIDQYSAETIESQQQIATLERQCSNLQDNYEKEKQKASSLEQKLKEAELRLQREQRHNLQFKAALDQCLETPGYVTPINIGTEEQQAPAIIASNSRIPKNEGIKPWSIYLEELDKLPEQNETDHQEKEAEIETKQENLIQKIKVLNTNKLPTIDETKKSPSPLITRSKYEAKPKTKRQIVLPQFSRLQLDDQR